MTTTAPPRASVTPQRLYKTVSIAEAITWTLLIIGMIGKYVFDFDALVFPFGLAHGIVFVSYAVVALLVGLNQRWKISRVALAVAVAIVPYATIPLDRSLEKRGLLVGDWRLEATDDPRDGGLVDRILRWCLRNPVALAVIVAVAVTVIVSALLAIGPPSSWGN